MRSITRMSWAEKIEKLISLGGGGGGGHVCYAFKRSPFDIYKLGFSVSSSKHLLDQQNLGSDSCHVLKEIFFRKFSIRHAVSHYTQSSLWMILIYT